MSTDQKHQSPQKFLWAQANIRLLPSAILCIAGAVMGSVYGSVRSGSINHTLIAVIGILTFIIFGVLFVRTLTDNLYRLMTLHHLNSGRAAAIQFVMRIIGYIIIFFITLDRLGIPVGKLLLGGAALGIILGVAAQQALANFFASIVLIISHPYSIGQHVIINSGALGGKYTGEIKDIGLTHTRLLEKDGSTVLLPNSTLLAGATITVGKTPVASTSKS